MSESPAEKLARPGKESFPDPGAQGEPQPETLDMDAEGHHSPRRPVNPSILSDTLTRTESEFHSIDASDAENGGQQNDELSPQELNRVATQMSSQDPPLGTTLAAPSRSRSRGRGHGGRRDVADEDDEALYTRFSRRRKSIIVAFVAYCAFLSPISSTAVLSATPEVAATFASTGTVLNIVNALYLAFMGVSPLIWGPLSQVYGRKWVCIVTSALFFGCSVGTALAPNLAAFFIFRILTALEGTSFLITGAACIGDIYKPTERATAMGWYFMGTLVGPALGPFIGGVIVTYTSWRVIFWLQSGLAGLAFLGAVFVLPETAHHKKSEDLAGLSRVQKARVLWRMINPWNVLRHYRHRKLVLVAAASSSLVWNMYALLTPIPYVLNPRFNLSSPMQGGFFYLAPGAGYLTGTLFGGRFADYIMKVYIRRRGVRVPEDRLRSALPFLALVMPACVLVYGWAIQEQVGGIPVPVVMMFIQGVAQLFCFPSLNTYCLDVMQEQGAEVIAGNFVVRYLFGCAASAVALPAIDSIGVGGFSTVSAGFMLVTAFGLLAVVQGGSISIPSTKKKEKRASQRTDS